MNAASEQLSTAAPTTGLSERDREVLAFERQWWKYAGSKETAIKELFDMSATRYYQVLNALIDHPSALEHDPMLVKRLRRLQSEPPARPFGPPPRPGALTPEPTPMPVTPVREGSRTGVPVPASGRYGRFGSGNSTGQPFFASWSRTRRRSFSLGSEWV